MERAVIRRYQILTDAPDGFLSAVKSVTSAEVVLREKFVGSVWEHLKVPVPERWFD